MRTAFVAVRDADGSVVKPGDVFESRGEKFKFIEVARPPSLGKSGRVYVESMGEDWKQEFFPHVFGLTLKIAPPLFDVNDLHYVIDGLEVLQPENEIDQRRVAALIARLRNLDA